MNNIKKHTEDRSDLLTEAVNPLSNDLDLMSTRSMVELFSQQDLEPQKAVAAVLHDISKAIDEICLKLSNGGRLFYLGAGTSGRLGVLDAAECPPTFCTPPELIQGIIAGGKSAITKSAEDIEDFGNAAIENLYECSFGSNDCLVGITAGGTTPFVKEALKHAKNINSLSIAIACVPQDQAQLDDNKNLYYDVHEYELKGKNE